MDIKYIYTSVIGAVVGCIIFSIVLFFVNPSVFTKNNNVEVKENKKDITPIVINSSSIPEATEKIMPSVVYIDTKSFTKVNRPVANIFGIPAYRSQVVPQKGSGSGVVIDKSGLILTNEHVIHGATEITVTFQNDESYPAVIKGSDPVSDIALIQIKTDKTDSEIKPAVLGDSDKLKIGEPVIAVGSPYHFQQSVTYGVISARGRNLSDQSKDFQDLLQTDAAINPGNSGGPLVNLKGEVIGINTAIIPYAQGIGFSIPINTVKNIVNQLNESGRVIRPYIGTSIQDLNKHLAYYLRYDGEPKGVVVIVVSKGSPAEDADIRPNDIILKADGKTLSSSEDLRRIIRNSKPGDVISLDVWRNGEIINISVTTAGN